MDKDILTQIRKRYESFSKGQKAVAKYIMESYEQSAFFTAGKMAKTVGVSESTVVRFAVELGYSGFPAMQKDLQTLVLDKLRQEDSDKSFLRMTGDPLTESMLADIGRIQKTLINLDREAFQEAVEAVLHARRVVIIGARASAVLAEYAGMCLERMLDSVSCVINGSTGDMCEKLLGMTSEDVVLAFGFPKYESTTVECLDFCLARDAKIIGFTDGRESPIGRKSTFILAAEWDSTPVFGALSAPMSLLCGFIGAVAARRTGELTAFSRGLEEIWRKYHVYEYVEDEKR